MTSTPDNRLIARRYLSELWSRGKLATADELIAPTCELHDPLCGLRRGPDAIKAAVCELRLPFPDLAFSLDAFIVEAGDQLALRWFAHGTHRAPLLGIPATDRAFAVSGLLLLRCRAGKLVAITACWEPTHLLHQLGLLGTAPVVEVDKPTTPKRSEQRCASSFVFAAASAESELDAGWA